MSGRRPTTTTTTIAAKKTKKKKTKISVVPSLTPLVFQPNLLSTRGWAKRAARRTPLSADFGPLPVVARVKLLATITQFVVFARDAEPRLDAWNASTDQWATKLQQLLQAPPSNRLKRRHAFSQFLQWVASDPVAGIKAMLTATTTCA